MTNPWSGNTTPALAACKFCHKCGQRLKQPLVQCIYEPCGTLTVPKKGRNDRVGDPP